MSNVKIPKVNPIVYSMTPGVRQAVVPVPNPKEFSPNDWRQRIFLDAPHWEEPADIQSDNYRVLNEPSHNILKNKMFGPLSNPNLIYGHTQYPLNPLEQQQTNRPVNQIYKVTRVQDVNGVNKINHNLAIQYPVPTYYRQSFQGSTQQMRNLPLGVRFPDNRGHMFG